MRGFRFRSTCRRPTKLLVKREKKPLVPRVSLRGSLIEKGGFFERGGLIKIAKMVECKVEKLKYTKLEFMQPWIFNKSELPAGE